MLTKAGNILTLRELIEEAWTYRFPVQVSPTLQALLEDLPEPVHELAWKG